MDRPISLNDPLNLRGFIEEITEYIRDNCTTENAPKNVISFLSIILSGLEVHEKEKANRITTMQRLLSGNIPYSTASVQNLVNEICSGAQDKILLEKFDNVAAAILSSPNGDDFFNRVFGQCSFRFFSEGEKRELAAALENKAYSRFLLALLKHGFNSLYNLPCFFSERLYAEAITCDWDSPHRYSLMKIAADNGSKAAAIEYANYLARRFGRESDAYHYFEIALPNPAAVWSVANRIEIQWISQELVPRFKEALRLEEKLAGPSFAQFLQELEGIVYQGLDPAKAETMIFLYKVYFYLAYSSPSWFKGFASMAKQLETGMIQFSGPGGKDKAARLIEKYRAAAIKASNVISFLAVGGTMLQQRMTEGKYLPESQEEQQMLELLELASNMDLLYGNLYLGDYYEYASHHVDRQSEKREAARASYLRAEALDTNGDGRGGKLWLRLGIVSDSQDDKIRYFDKALKAGQADAAYYIADMEAELYFSEGTDARLHLYKAVKLLKANLPLISEEHREMADLLYRALISTITEDGLQ